MEVYSAAVSAVPPTSWLHGGFKATFNPTYPVESSNPCGCVSPWHYGLNQVPIVLMIENYRTGLLWQLMRELPFRKRSSLCMRYPPLGRMMIERSVCRIVGFRARMKKIEDEK
jgi:hypothetical protein